MQRRISTSRHSLGWIVLLGSSLGLLAATEGFAQQPTDKQPVKPLSERLKMPPELPGADAAPIPKAVSSGNKDEREAAVDRLYRPLPTPGALPPPLPGPEGRPLSLADLQHLALENSPLVRQARADVDAARGAAVQAGLWPNPNVGYAGDQIKPGLNSGQQGLFIEQIIKTAGKPGLARAVAGIDVLNAEVALRRVESDLLTQVRSGYFAVLVAQTNVRTTGALARFTEEVYKIQVDQLKGGAAAAYEPMQLQVLALQARTALVQAHNRYVSAWKQLTATLSLPAMPLTELAGRVDMPIPRYEYDAILARILSDHTDVQTAQNAIQRAQLNLRLAKLTPVPDITTHAAFQHDNADGHYQYGLQFGIALPVWDRNQGNIRQAEAQLGRALEDVQRAQNDLRQRLADAYERYENNRIILGYYREQMLPNQVRVYRGVYERHGVEPDKVSFGDVVNAQQTLATTITAYLGALDAQWKAVVDLAGLLQIDDLFSLGAGECVAPIPDLERLALPCGQVEGNWPPAATPEKALPMPQPSANER